MSSQLKLSHYWRSSCSWRVRWALELKQLKYDEEIIDLKTGIQGGPGFKKKNPAGFVPSLEVPGVGVINDSIAIIEWLDESYKGVALLPSASFKRAKVRELAAIIAAGTQPLQNLFVLNTISGFGQNKLDWARMIISRGLRTYESSIQTTAGKYSMGSQVSLADLCLIPQVYNAHRFKVNMHQYPLCDRIYQNAILTPECKKAAPENQTGAEK